MAIGGLQHAENPLELLETLSSRWHEERFRGLVDRFPLDGLHGSLVGHRRSCRRLHPDDCHLVYAFKYFKYFK